MPSVVDVVNRALDKLGYGAITSLSDGTKAANLADRTWPIVRDQMLRDNPWNFAVKRTTTAPLSEAPSWGFSYQHELPSDLLRLLEVRDLSSGEYQVEGSTVLTDESVLYIRYIAQITDPNAYDSLFIEALSAKLALEMCEELTQSNTKKRVLAEEYREALVRARGVDAVENPPTVFEEDLWVEVRY